VLNDKLNFSVHFILFLQLFQRFLTRSDGRQLSLFRPISQNIRQDEATLAQAPGHTFFYVLWRTITYR
jgi:hypothetical protein